MDRKLNACRGPIGLGWVYEQMRNGVATWLAIGLIGLDPVDYVGGLCGLYPFTKSPQHPSMPGGKPCGHVAQESETLPHGTPRAPRVPNLEQRPDQLRIA